MHCNSNTFLFRNNELENEFTIVHIPQLYDAILTTACYYIILVELVKLIFFIVDFELTGWHILELTRID